MSNLLHQPSFWVLVATVIFIALVWKKLWLVITHALDKRSEQIKKELEEAVRLREEAQTILANYQKKEQESLEEAERIIEQTRADAAAMTEKAEAELQEMLEKRKALALAKISHAETKAIQAVQEHVVDIAVSAAKMVIQEQLASGRAEELIKLATADIERKLH